MKINDIDKFNEDLDNKKDDVKTAEYVNTEYSGSRIPGGSYTDKKVKGVIDRVTLTLEGMDGAVFDEMAERFHFLDSILKETEDHLESLTKDIKKPAMALWDAEDLVVTKVIETSKSIITLSKRTPPNERISYDHEHAWGEMLKLLDKNLVKQAEAILDATKKVTKVKPKDVELSSVVLKNQDVKESIGSSLFQKIKDFTNKILGRTKKWEMTYDQKLAEIVKHLDEVNPVNESEEKMCECGMTMKEDCGCNHKEELDEATFQSGVIGELTAALEDLSSMLNVGPIKNYFIKQGNQADFVQKIETANKLIRKYRK